jgi:REP-associated tyrosine transposase
VVEFRRKPNRLTKEWYTGRNWYFVTVCTAGRAHHFAEQRVVQVVLQALREASRANLFGVYSYCFMPEHLHLELAGQSDHAQLAAMMRAFKGLASARAREGGIRNLWQKGFYDHVLRPRENENAVAWYIFNNPVRKNLIADPRSWPYSGSWMFDWKRAVAPPQPFVPPWKP